MPVASSADRDAGLVLVTVSSAERRLDLQLPGWLPLAELVPGLARGLGLRDGPWRVATADGRILDVAGSLLDQGVEDGAVLAVVPRARAAVVHDDPAEAMAAAVEDTLPAARPRARECVAGAGQVGLLLVGLAALAAAGRPAAALAAGAAGALFLAAVVRGAVPGPVGSAALVLMSAAYVGTCGFAVSASVPVVGLSVALAGAGVLVVGVVAALASTRHRALGQVLALGGALVLLLGAARTMAPFDPVPVLIGSMVLVVLGETVLPWLVLPAAGRGVDDQPAAAGDQPWSDQPWSDQSWSDRGLPDADGPPGRDDLHRRVAVGHRRLLVSTALVGVLTTAVAPVVVSTGATGTALAGACALLVLLRGRHQRSAAAVVTGTVAGVVAALVTVGAAVWLHPGVRLPVGIAAVLVAGSAPVVSRVGSPARREHLLELLQALATVSLAPLALLATGLADRLRW